jgi:ATP-binding cassette subfamily F protein uup
MARRSRELAALGDDATAEEARRAWGILCSALDTIVEVLGDSRCDIPSFVNQLSTSLEDASVGHLPVHRDEVTVGGVRKHIYSYLADFLFAPERVRTPVKALSGGERARLMLAKLFLKPSNLLIMDEPTNDLDIETLELLEEQLLAYKGTLLLVSHDREFLDNVVTSTFVLEGDAQVRTYPGGYEEYFAQSAARRQAQQAASEAAKRESAPQSVRQQHAKKLSFNEQRELAALPDKIAALEEEIAQIKDVLADGSIFKSDPTKAQEYFSRMPVAEAELESAVERWAELEERNGA